MYGLKTLAVVVAVLAVSFPVAGSRADVPNRVLSQPDHKQAESAEFDLVLEQCVGAYYHFGIA